MSKHTRKCAILTGMKTYTCRIHGTAPHYDYLISTTGYHQRTCKLCRAEEVRQLNLKLRRETIASYGGECECCGETEPRFLTIDHVKGDGQESRRTFGSGNKLYRALKRKGFPKEGLRLLCYNCNCSRGQYGKCPHETKGE
jgi:hypothetical protein